MQDKIELFQKTECVATKNKIFDVHILPAFRDLVQSLISVYKFKATNEDIDHLKSDCVTFLFETIYKWKPEYIKELIYSLSEIELQIKKNIDNSINLITDFILIQSSAETNN